METLNYSLGGALAIKEKWKNTRILTISTAEAVKRALKVIEGNQKILLFYLFGSRVMGTESPESDIDFAFLSSKDFSWEEYYSLHGRLSSVLGTDRFNLLWLNKADPIITFEVIARGRPLYFKDSETLNDFELKAKKNYYDYKYYLERRRRGL